MTEESIAEAVVDVLRDFVENVRRRLSCELGGVAYHGASIHGDRSPYASFWMAHGDDELVLSVSLRGVDAGLQCECDLGVRKETLATMPTAILKAPFDPRDVEVMLRALRDFARSQETKAIDVLQEDARGYRRPDVVD
jgi:hypothetical protein